jgi:polyphenol oxidase
MAPVLAPECQLIPEWDAPAGVRAMFSMRGGGVSLPPFDSFNLGDHVRDEPAAVARNRALLAQTLGAHPVFLQQVHGNEVVPLDSLTPDGTEGDACVTAQRGLACTIMVADCLPVLFAHDSGPVVAAAHAGWRGLAGDVQGRGVLETTLDALEIAVRKLRPDLSGADWMDGVHAWLGPCIGPKAFEVGPEVRAAFMARQPEAQTAFRPAPDQAGASGKWLADLPALARQRLVVRGVTRITGNDSGAAWCTVTNPSQFFSHRRDAVRLGSTGRMAACIWID